MVLLCSQLLLMWVCQHFLHGFSNTSKQNTYNENIYRQSLEPSSCLHTARTQQVFGYFCVSWACPCVRRLQHIGPLRTTTRWPGFWRRSAVANTAAWLLYLYFRWENTAARGSDVVQHGHLGSLKNAAKWPESRQMQAFRSSNHVVSPLLWQFGRFQVNFKFYVYI